MVFFKRLSRGSRSNSYAEDDFDRPRSQDPKFGKFEPALDSPRQSTSQHNNFGTPAPTSASPTKEPEREMYRRSQAPQDPYSQRGVSNGANSRQNSAAFEASPLGTPGKVEQTPDLLTRAFNEAVRPYSEKIEQLESQIVELQAWAEKLEHQRNEMYSWIDKRGLRPGMLLTRLSCLVAREY